MKGITKTCTFATYSPAQRDGLEKLYQDLSEDNVRGRVEKRLRIAETAEEVGLSRDQVRLWLRNRKNRGAYKGRNSLTVEQVRVLEWLFVNHSEYPSPLLKREIALELSLTYAQVQKWFKSRRQRGTPALLEKFEMKEDQEWEKTIEKLTVLIKNLPADSLTDVSSLNHSVTPPPTMTKKDYKRTFTLMDGASPSPSPEPLVMKRIKASPVVTADSSTELHLQQQQQQHYRHVSSSRRRPSTPPVFSHEEQTTPQPLRNSRKSRSSSMKHAQQLSSPRPMEISPSPPLHQRNLRFLFPSPNRERQQFLPPISSLSPTPMGMGCSSASTSPYASFQPSPPHISSAPSRFQHPPPFSPSPMFHYSVLPQRPPQHANPFFDSSASASSQQPQVENSLPSVTSLLHQTPSQHPIRVLQTLMESVEEDEDLQQQAPIFR
mmetsp:Transcript_5386/g.6918  ORF Transcript_5386/g.6918 Transcript_5386/m.6918 type:complete len:434 (-) Transcript_5386:86-1387(-)|eukprot:CAMPEP_0201491956 /NCGR_PEP_ID=MMETSP0151_2-20130828/31904_1 /ASSEMBLY_ACC=CAM_ASM_000257 /TAXON_ID=200890 /ORGANISM="Paramoeba atlantica, Strain 621/1 / CCAP 1560/9" /LENGTH=433 /DNA_ID=CAMNT_0047878583 /DNA_START=100 /DNA_END=1401 /DNA_ORIENTATION=+